MQDTQELLDRYELSELTARLSRWLDERRFDESAGLFTEDAVAKTPGGLAEGLPALVAQASRNHGQAASQHLFSDVLVDHHGDKADLRANSFIAFVTDQGPELHGSRYTLEAVRTPDGWRISRLEVSPVWTTAAA